VQLVLVKMKVLLSVRFHPHCLIHQLAGQSFYDLDVFLLVKEKQKMVCILKETAILLSVLLLQNDP